MASTIGTARGTTHGSWRPRPISLILTNCHALAVVFAVLFVLLNMMLTLLIVQPITQLSATADQISKGRIDVPDFSDKGRDEVSQLGQAFNRMRRSLEKAIALIDKA